MLQEVARKRPAVVVSATAVETRPIPSADKLIIRSPHRGQLAAEVTRRWRAGEIERNYRTGRQGGFWVAEVTLVPDRSWLRRHGLVAGLVTLAGLAVVGVIVALVRALAPLLAALLPYFLGLLVLGVVLALVGGGTKITQIVNIKK